MKFEEVMPSPERKSDPTSEERFFLTERAVLDHLFRGDEQQASLWISRGNGRNGVMLRETTERHLRGSENIPDDVVVAKIAEELRPSSQKEYRKVA